QDVLLRDGALSITQVGQMINHMFTGDVETTSIDALGNARRTSLAASASSGIQACHVPGVHGLYLAMATASSPHACIFRYGTCKSSLTSTLRVLLLAQR